MIRTLAAWALFWLGHWTSQVLALVPDDDAWEKMAEGLYVIYNRLMVASLKVQGDRPGPWNGGL